MSVYQPAITKEGKDSFFALIVRIDSNGEETVIRGYQGRHFKSKENAERSTGRYINKFLK